MGRSTRGKIIVRLGKLSCAARLMPLVCVLVRKGHESPQEMTISRTKDMVSVADLVEDVLNALFEGRLSSPAIHLRPACDAGLR